ncbi:hypothetical protein AX16_009720, partial [Volvariella volvacea WC 439]
MQFASILDTTKKTGVNDKEAAQPEVVVMYGLTSMSTPPSDLMPIPVFPQEKGNSHAGVKLLSPLITSHPCIVSLTRVKCNSMFMPDSDLNNLYFFGPHSCCPPTHTLFSANTNLNITTTSTTQAHDKTANTSLKISNTVTAKPSKETTNAIQSAKFKHDSPAGTIGIINLTQSASMTTMRTEWCAGHLGPRTSHNGMDSDAASPPSSSLNTLGYSSNTSFHVDPVDNDNELHLKTWLKNIPAMDLLAYCGCLHAHRYDMKVLKG